MSKSGKGNSDAEDDLFLSQAEMSLDSGGETDRLNNGRQSRDDVFGSSLGEIFVNLADARVSGQQHTSHELSENRQSDTIDHSLKAPAPSAHSS